MVDGTGLENRHTLTGIGGSNPSLSASPLISAILAALDYQLTNKVKVFLPSRMSDAVRKNTAPQKKNDPTPF